MDSVEQLLSAARSETGLDDFGEDCFRDPLERLVRSIGFEARLTPSGEVAIRDMIVQRLAQRLQVEDWYRRHPEIADEPIEVLIGVGLPRTGSTALSYLLAEDPDTRSLRRYEAFEPCPPPSTVRGPDPRIKRRSAEVEQWSASRKAMVPMDAVGPTECQMVMALDFQSLILANFAGHVPSYIYWLLYDADFTSTYEYERKVLKLLQWGSPPRPWRLKCPYHLVHIDALNHAFPDAKFVVTHRDPAEVVVSFSGLSAEVARAFSDDIDLQYWGSLNVAQWSLGMQRALAFRDAQPTQRFYDIDFRAMQRDPLGEVRGLYAWMGQPVTEEFEAGMQRWWRENAEARTPAVYPEPAAFGINMDEVRKRFPDYAERMARWTARGRQ
jgi:hypothetical protein